MKKAGFWMVLAVLFSAVLFLPAQAQTKGRVSLTFEAEKLARSDLFATQLECNRNPGVSSLRVTLRFDPKVLEVYSVEDTELFPGFHTDTEPLSGELVLRWKTDQTQGDLDATGHLAKIVFRVKDDAVLGDTKVEALIQERFFDAQDARGNAVVFETEGIFFTLECLHVRLSAETVTEPDFSHAGQDLVTCLDCNENWEEETLPSLLSSDGKTQGLVQPGQYAQEDEKGLRCDFLYGGAQYELAKTLFGDTIIRTFQVSFTKNDSIFDPQGETPIFLTTEFDLPEQFVLYLLRDGSAEKAEASFSGGILSFEHETGVFVLVSKETQLPQAQKPTVTTAPPSTQIPVSTLPEEEQARRREAVILGVGIGAVFLFGAGAVLVLRKGKRF